MKIECHWKLVSKVFLRKVEKPSVLDLLAMDRSLPRSEIHADKWGPIIKKAREKLADDIRKAAKILADGEVTEEDLWSLTERGVQRRLSVRFGK